MYSGRSLPRLPRPLRTPSEQMQHELVLAESLLRAGMTDAAQQVMDKVARNLAAYLRVPVAAPPEHAAQGTSPVFPRAVRKYDMLN